jgi:murein DD-endopeptidase MepM/ murein hydrolase activator NlpD
MRKFSQIVSTVTLVALLGLGGQAIATSAEAAETACGSMLMPAAQLKTMSRGFSRYHSGADLIAPYGSPVRAAEAGTVIFAGRYFGYGNMVDIQHPDGLVTRYAHLSVFAKGLHAGNSVSLGETIGNIGTTGHAHGAHLHFEVRINGRAVDPAPYLALASCPTGPGFALEEARAPEQSAPALPTQPSRPSPAAH